MSIDYNIGDMISHSKDIPKKVIFALKEEGRAKVFRNVAIIQP